MSRLSRKVKIILIVAVASLFLLSGIGIQAMAAQKKFVIGASIMNSVEPFYVDIMKGYEAAAKDFGVELIKTSAEGDVERTISIVEDYIVQGVDAIVLCPPDSAAVVPAVKAANKAGIPFFTIDINSTSGNIVNFTASSNYKGGQILGYFVANYLHGKGLVIVEGTHIITSTGGRMTGFTDVLDKYPGIEWHEYEVTFSREKAMKVTEDVLLAYPNVDVIFGAYGADTGLGATKAIKEAGCTTVKVVNFDAVPESRKLIYDHDPVLIADVAQQTFRMGYTSIKYAVQYLKGGEVPKEDLLPCFLVTSDNLVKINDEILILGMELP